MMRLANQEITNREEIDQVIRSCRACHLGLSDETTPYVVPMCFGYDGTYLFLHCAGEGKKLEVLHKNNRVCIEFSMIGDPIPNKNACGWNMDYKSVIIFGNAHFIENTEEKRKALQSIIIQYNDGIPLEIPEHAARHTCVVRIEIESITGKHS